MLIQDKSTKLWEPMTHTPGHNWSWFGQKSQLRSVASHLHIRIHFTPLNQKKDKGNPNTKTPI